MQPGATPEEKERITRLRNGNQAAFQQVFSHYAPVVFRFICRFTRSEAAAEELLHDVFLKVWENRTALNPELSFNAYLHTIAKNHAFNYLKQTARREALKKEIHFHASPAHNQVEESVIHAEYEQLAFQAIAQLPPQRQVVYKLCRQEERSYDEVAGMLGISRNAVKDHLVKAAKSLRRFFQAHTDLTLLVVLLLGF